MKEQPESRGAFGSLRVHLALGDFSGDGGGGGGGKRSGLTLPITAPLLAPGPSSTPSLISCRIYTSFPHRGLGHTIYASGCMPSTLRTVNWRMPVWLGIPCTFV
jgi:hypothetical protein